MTWVPQDRFAQDQFLHPRKNERGRAYTFAAGALEDIWGFDPAVFQISPREAEQMDPQQRILLQLAWEALESAGITPSSIAGSNVGVFVGGSLTDYAHAFLRDPAVGDSHFATGNALAALSNRISYAFDLQGPSVTIDTACSSSLVALHQAAEAIRAGRIDTAIVAGVNIIASAMSFITFSQASMLSPTGLCRAFDAAADGFVRGEGGVAVVLRRSGLAHSDGNPIRGVIVASDVNSDGRTSGISLPSMEGQSNLLSHLYGRSGVQLQKLAFMEAHGTGTPVGDPIEAAAIGETLASRREEPLLLGSIKTNIGHLEPASGLAGLLKAMLALEHRVLPPSLHFQEPNPNIDLEALNLKVCTEATPLPAGEDVYAGVNSFGFGGTNAHVIVGPGSAEPPPPVVAAAPKALVISAATRTALAGLAGRYRDRLADASDQEAQAIAGAAAFRRDRLAHRLVVSGASRNGLLQGLEAYLEGRPSPQVQHGAAAGEKLPTVFVFTGNGGRPEDLWKTESFSNPVFRERFEEIDEHFALLAGWSLKGLLASEPSAERLGLTSVVQPLIFAVQSASAAALMAGGLRPELVLGHSVGEIAAAHAAGILSTKAAVDVIYHRSRRQELLRGAGGMAAVSASREDLADLVEDVPGLQVAAINSPRAATVAGPADALAQAALRAQAMGVPFLDLGIEYPFHTDALDQIHGPLAEDLAGLSPAKGEARFISTVTARVAAGRELDASYWWRNVRDPVRFEEAVREAARLGGRCFIEIGPTSLLAKHMAASLRDETESFAFLSVAGGAGDEDGADPAARAIGRALVAGADIDPEAVFGEDPGGAVSLPSYAWDQRPFRLEPTSEAVGTAEAERHRYAGVRSGHDALEWRSFLDTVRCPELIDHKVSDQVLFPATAFLEIGFAAAERWLGDNRVSLNNFEILRALDLSSGETSEVMARIGAGAGLLEIMSRPRLSSAPWTLNCRSKVQRARALGDRETFPADADGAVLDNDGFYAVTRECGFNYGPEFARAERVVRVSDDEIHVTLSPKMALDGFVVHPILLDACIQGLISVFPELGAPERGVAYIPVRVDEALVVEGGARLSHAVIKIRSRNDRSILNDIMVYGPDGRLVVSLLGARCQAVPLRRVETFETAAIGTRLEPGDGSILGVTGVAASTEALAAALGAPEASSSFDGHDLLEGWAIAAAWEIAGGLARGGLVSPQTLVDTGRTPEVLAPWLEALLGGLERAGLAQAEAAGWRLAPGADMPPSQEVVRSLIAEAPARGAEILMAAELSAFADRVRAAGRIEADWTALAPATAEFGSVSDEADGRLQEVICRALSDRIDPGERSLRVLLLGGAILPERLEALGPSPRVTITETDPARLARLRELVDGSSGARLTAELSAEPEAYDLIVATDSLNRLPEGTSLDQLSGLLAPDGLLLAAEPSPSLFRDMASGLNPAWFLAGARTGRLRPAGGWAQALEAAGLTSVVETAAPRGGRPFSLILGRKPQPGRCAFKAGLAADTATSLQAALANARLQDGGAIHLVPPVRPGEDPVSALAARCLGIREAARRADQALWIVFSEALGDAEAEPVMAGAFAFSKTLANEYAHLAVRLVDTAADAAPGDIARRLESLMACETNERQFRVEANALKVVRAGSLRRAARRCDEAPTAARLQRGARSTRRLQWAPAQRTAPGPGEVEIAVSAASINFRDLMCALGLLPEDMLEGGFAGASLGLECAGRVVRVGADPGSVKVGDQVVAVSGGALSSHVTVRTGQILPLPKGLDLEAAATIPVAYLTAYYGLVSQARLQPNEWVLIHGGAGGVGLAAIQVAQRQGARIIATAGSDAKRALLKTLGVDQVLDSRSTGFAEAVKAITGGGVQVVLNSLSGEAMELSLQCLAPFGRFVELGKRDFAADTHIGLRVFRNNLSYFAVDIDQLIGQPEQAARLLSEVSDLVAEGSLPPLPHTVFDSDRVTEAFGLIQRSAHIGKLVVRPPSGAGAEPAGDRPVIDAAGAHLVTGAFGGFGLETAKWLVKRGARSLILISRSGPASAEADLALQQFAKAGVKVIAEACDVTDRAALGALLDRAAKALPPIVGVFHAAMVLDDALLDDLDEARIRKVLEPKVRGVEVLQELTRDLQLKHFVLYSSVTTLFGNPGQGAYVAANAYMEGVARRRRAAGLPALAVGWGPISDVGVVARNSKLLDGLRKLTGARSLTARDALNLLERALDYQTTAPRLADLAIAPNDGAFSTDRLAVLASPTYASLTVNGKAGSEAAASIDVLALLAQGGREAAIEKVEEVVARELAQVLHADEAEISRNRPLIEFGIDSLMALELALRLEEAFGQRLPLRGSVGGMTIAKLAAAVVGGAGREPAEAEPAPAAKAAPAPAVIAAAE